MTHRGPEIFPARDAFADRNSIVTAFVFQFTPPDLKSHVFTIFHLSGVGEH
jgi:hypothetical protein